MINAYILDYLDLIAENDYPGQPLSQTLYIPLDDQVRWEYEWDCIA